MEAGDHPLPDHRKPVDATKRPDPTLSIGQIGPFERKEAEAIAGLSTLAKRAARASERKESWLSVFDIAALRSL